MINEKLEKLNQEIAKGEARLRRAQHEEKILEHQVKQLIPSTSAMTQRAKSVPCMCGSLTLKPVIENRIKNVIEQRRTLLWMRATSTTPSSPP